MKEETEGFSIPICVKDGKGYAYLSSYPLSCTKIENMDVTVQSVIKMPEFPLHTTNYTIYDARTADDSVDQSGVLLKFDSTQYNTFMLEGIAQIMSEHETAHVSKVWRDGNYIFVLVESPIKRNDFIYPNTITALKNTMQ